MVAVSVRFNKLLVTSILDTDRNSSCSLHIWRFPVYTSHCSLIDSSVYITPNKLHLYREEANIWMSVIRALNDMFRFPVNLWFNADVLWRLCPNSWRPRFHCGPLREWMDGIMDTEEVYGPHRSLWSALLKTVMSLWKNHEFIPTQMKLTSRLCKSTRFT